MGSSHCLKMCVLDHNGDVLPNQVIFVTRQLKLSISVATKMPLYLLPYLDCNHAPSFCMEFLVAKTQFAVFSLSKALFQPASIVHENSCNKGPLNK